MFLIQVQFTFVPKYSRAQKLLRHGDCEMKTYVVRFLRGSKSFSKIFLCVLILQITWCSRLSVAANVTPTDVVNLLQTSSILAPGEKVSATVKDSEVSVYAYVNPNAKQIDNDCKIDAVLMARKIFSKYGQAVARVKLNFFERSNPRMVRIVTITAGDVAAFAAGSTSMQQLMSSLELRKEATKAASVPPPKGSPGVAPNAVALSRSGLINDTVPYTNRRSGLQLAYPRGWKLEEKHENHELATLSYGDSEGRGGFVVISAEPLPAGSRIDQYVQLIDQYTFPSTTSHIYSTTPVLLGKNQFRGICQSIGVTIDNKKMRSEVFFFQDYNEVFTVKCFAPEAHFSVMSPYFNTIMLSMVPPTQRNNTNSTNSTASSSQGSAFSIYRSPIGRFSFGYPASWEIKENPAKDELVKMEGLGPHLKGGAISLGVGDDISSLLSIEAHANQVEEYVSAQYKDLRRIDRAHVTIGSNDVLHDTLQFSANNLNCFEHIAFFHVDGKIYRLCLLAPIWTRDDARQVFEQVMRRISF